MATDREEARRLGPATKKRPKAHPYAAIEHRVIDSPAFADLSSSAVRLLVVMARQLNGKNNGQLQATYSYVSKLGINSEHTLKDALAQLVSHGFVYRTRSHGANRTWARYAVTWLPIQDKTGLFLDGFVSCAWRYWEPMEKKAPRKNCSIHPAETAVSPIRNPHKVQEGHPQKLQSMNLLPCSVVCSGSGMLYRQPVMRRLKPRYSIPSRGAVLIAP